MNDYDAPYNEIQEEVKTIVTLEHTVYLYRQESDKKYEDIFSEAREIIEEEINPEYEITNIEFVDKFKINNSPYKKAIWWSVEDFEYMAEQMFETITYYDESSPKSVQERAKKILSTCKDWKDYYDKSEFEYALDNMIANHDAEYGICWETIKCYLNEMCSKYN